MCLCVSVFVSVCVRERVCVCVCVYVCAQEPNNVHEGQLHTRNLISSMYAVITVSGICCVTMQ